MVVTLNPSIIAAAVEAATPIRAAQQPQESDNDSAPYARTAFARAINTATHRRQVLDAQGRVLVDALLMPSGNVIIAVNDRSLRVTSENGTFNVTGRDGLRFVSRTQGANGEPVLTDRLDLFSREELEETSTVQFHTPYRARDGAASIVLGQNPVGRTTEMRTGSADITLAREAGNPTYNPQQEGRRNVRLFDAEGRYRVHVQNPPERDRAGNVTPLNPLATQHLNGIKAAGFADGLNSYSVKLDDSIQHVASLEVDIGFRGRTRTSAVLFSNGEPGPALTSDPMVPGYNLNGSNPQRLQGHLYNMWNGARNAGVAVAPAPALAPPPAPVRTGAGR